MSEQNLDHLRDWIGKTESVTDTVTAWPVAALAATLDRREAAPQIGDELPPCGHWLFFLEAKPLSELGPDGHPKRGGFLPPVPLPRRMWAGGRLEFLHPVRIGDEIRRDSTILSVEAKHGRSGNLVFVTVEHAISSDGRVAIREEHDIVYRDAARPGPGRHVAGARGDEAAGALELAHELVLARAGAPERLEITGPERKEIVIRLIHDRRERSSKS